MTTFNATVGSYAANSYISVETAEDWMDMRLHKAEWTAATTADKEAALMWATRILERYSWKGEPSDMGISPPQALRWPRSYVLNLDGDELAGDTIPAFLQEATTELAFFLLKKDRTDDPEGIGFKRLKVDVIELEPDTLRAANTLPNTVMDLISPYLLRPLNSSVSFLKRA